MAASLEKLSSESSSNFIPYHVTWDDTTRKPHAKKRQMVDFRHYSKRRGKGNIPIDFHVYTVSCFSVVYYLVHTKSSIFMIILTVSVAILIALSDTRSG